MTLTNSYINDNIKVLSSITYNQEELQKHYYELCEKGKKKPYCENICGRTNFNYKKEIINDPCFRCICSACIDHGSHQHSLDGHELIVNVHHYKNPEVLRIINELEPIIGKTDKSSRVSFWIYKPFFNLPPHKDFSRQNVVLLPILPNDGGVGTYIYSENLPVISLPKFKTIEHNDDYVITEYKYSTKHPTLCNYGPSGVIHGCINDNNVRVYLHIQTKINIFDEG
jgi:hypothetical protein